LIRNTLNASGILTIKQLRPNNFHSKLYLEHQIIPEPDIHTKHIIQYL